MKINCGKISVIMNCLLCLEDFLDQPIKINEFQQESNEFISDIIKQHFWLKPEESIQDSICNLCWKLLKEFHEFYLRIKQQHEVLKHITNASESNQKRARAKRGKPPAKRLKVETNNESNATRRSLRSCRIKEEPATPMDNVSAQHLLEVLIKAEPEVDAIAQTADIYAKDPFENSAQDPAEEVVAEKVIDRKNDFKQKQEKSKEHDAYIKAHFRLKCNICELELDNFDVLKTHFRKEHSIRGYAVCCGRKFIKRGPLADHIHLHQDPKYFACLQCGKELADRYSMENHTKITHGEKRERVFKCETCAKSFFNRQIYERHLLMHVPEEKKQFNCTHCQKPFATQSMMNEHVKAVHLLLNAHICDVCGKLIRGGTTALQRHQEEHQGIPQKPIVCQICGLTVTTKYGLVRHTKRQHVAENRAPRTCPYCNKISPGLTAHQYHVKYMHEIERKHSCTMCDKAFKRARDLKEHMTTHTGEVLYTCAHCPKTFNSHANMHSHRKKVHRKEWEEKRMQKYLQTNLTTQT